jgi:hypothetical protein
VVIFATNEVAFGRHRARDDGYGPGCGAFKTMLSKVSALAAGRAKS